ncbi:nectin-4-like [Colossoma macropomum]|uniref:nectin-4-like n=1 Tax=Colossoma macropomum TaxID=42526 RepID=UPI0018645CAD|nr:nectin-4-like [Colossoma macropomum]
MIFRKHIFLICCMLMISCCRIKAIRVIGRSTTVIVGDNARMFCQLIEANEKLTRITWQKRTRQTLTNKNFFVITPEGKTENINGLGDRTEFIGNTQEIIGSILLRNVLLLDEGVYTCIFNIFPSGPFETEIHLNVQVPPVVDVTTDVIPVVGESEVTLATCTAAKAQPAAVVSWSLGALSDSVKVQTNISPEPDGSFTVQSYLIGVASKDLNQQKVQCLVNHTSLNKELILDHTLVIHYPPGVVYIRSVVSTTSQEFQCVADANPQPTFTWSRANKPLSSYVDADRLIIPLTSDSNGLYMCNASNQYGNGTGTLYVHIFRECTTVCWMLFIILLLLLGVTAIYLIWKFCLIRELIKFTSNLTERIWHSEHAPVATDSDRPTCNGHQNLEESSEQMHQTLIHQAQCHQQRNQDSM